MPTSCAKRVRAGAIELLIAFLLALGASGFAQVTTADIVGHITDGTGAVLPGATITLRNLHTGDIRAGNPTASGDYAFNLLPAGSYSVRIEAAGFRTFTVPEEKLMAGDRARLDVQMQVGQAAETIEVLAATSALQTDTATLSNSVTLELVQDLPLNGRNFIQLAQLTQGATEGSPGALASGARPDDRRLTSALSVNGQSDVLNNFMIDGADNNERIIGTIGVKPSIEAIDEFQVQSNLYSAEAGRTAGGVVNLITKSGTNRFHGSLYEFFRNDKLDARNYFASPLIAKPELRQNQFGGSLGGPIKKDKTFFFADYEGFRQVAGQTSTSTVPTLAEEQNPSMLIGGAKPNPTGLAYFRLYPAPNVADNPAYNFVDNLNKEQNTNTFDVRIDHRLNARNTFFGRYTFNDSSTFTPSSLPPVTIGATEVQPGGQLADFAGSATQRAQNLHLNFVHVIDSSMMLELKAAYTRINTLSEPLNQGQHLTDGPFRIPGVELGPATDYLPEIYSLTTPLAVVGSGVFLPLNDIDNTFQYSSVVTMTRGAHNLSVGATLIRRQAMNDQSNLGDGLWLNFGGLAGLLNGGPFIVERSIQTYAPGYRTWEPSLYLQDNWRAKPWLTLNLGLRYDIFTPFTEAHDHLSNFDPSTGAVIVASASDPTAGVKTDYGNLAPRVGFAATLGRGTVLRGGAGLVYFPANYTSAANLKNPPFVETCCESPVNFSTGLPPASLIPANQLSGAVSGVAVNMVSSSLQQFNLNLQKDIGGGNIVEVGYVGELGRHLGTWIPNLNLSAPPGYNAATGTANAAGALPFPALGQVQYLSRTGSSSYNSLQTKYERRYKNGLTVNANYTWAHGIDDVMGIDTWGGSNNGYGVLLAQIASVDRGNSDLDIRHHIAVSASYELPFGASLNGIKAGLFKGWHLNAIYVWETGMPFTIVNSSPGVSGINGLANSGPGGGTDRPNQIGSASLSNPTLNEWFNTSAFAAQLPGTLGNAGRNQLYGPHQRRCDLSLAKSFAVGENSTLQFRAEAFNLTNTANFANPGTNGTVSNQLQQPTFGTIGATSPNYTPREAQLVLRLSF